MFGEGFPAQVSSPSSNRGSDLRDSFQNSSLVGYLGSRWLARLASCAFSRAPLGLEPSPLFSASNFSVRTWKWASGRESYGDSAIGYVQVKYENNLCTVRAIATPEHKISKKGYGVTVICNEEDEVVLSALCDSCAASLGEYIGILLS
ncbi:hypothetical protein AVEN_60408-1 [Araneus ventricosus]|uniref:Uncharacterized protein n=1 Tax=Araneus ventricosus TaxID=182803 RepID=A0A4Y2GYT1_ARAVE|nr:hypothetical protein AVEN_60408-1 [Araneus ventricosus]